MGTEVQKIPTKIFPPAELVEMELSQVLRRQRGLRHSLIYQDPRVVKIIADWLRAKRVIGENQNIVIQSQKLNKSSACGQVGIESRGRAYGGGF